jgi:tetratricopeptide (TPR) repeat protein
LGDLRDIIVDGHHANGSIPQITRLAAGIDRGARHSDAVDFDPADPRNLIYARPSEHGKIFVSSKMSGGALKAERRAAVEAIEEIPLWRAWAWEDSAEAGPYCSERECVAQAGTSDGLVLIVEGELTPITRSELKAAQDTGVPIFVMLKTGVARDAELERLVKRVRGEGNTTVNFSSPGELKTRVAKALRTLALRWWRTRMLERREAAGTVAEGGAQSAEDFRGVQVSAGEGGSVITIAELVARGERRVLNGDAAEVLDELWWVAQGAYDVGLGWLALKLLEEIDRIVPAEAIDDRWQGWICNLRGMALSQGASSAAARAEYERTRQLGKALDDADLESTALQNLGVQDVFDGDHAAARAKFTQSLELKRELGDWHGGLQVLFNLVHVFVGQERLDLADRLLDDLDALMSNLRDPFLRSSLHGNRGTVAIARGDLKTAQDEFRKALRCARRSGSTPRIITSMQNLGSVAHDLGEPARARRWYAQALELAEGIDDLTQKRIQRQALALAHLRLGEYDRAAELFLRVADDATGLDDQVHAAIALGDAGGSLMQAGDAERARELTERALAMPGGNDHWRAQQLTNLAAELNALGEPEPAVARLLEAANLTSEPAERAEVLRYAGEFAISSPETAGQAPRIFQQELQLRREHEPSERWAWRTAEIGATLSHTSQTAAALEFFTIALRVFARRSDRRQAFFIRNDRALANADLRNLPSALTDLTACLQIAREMNDGALTQQTHMNLGEIQRRKGDHPTAAGHLNRALSIARRLQDSRAEGDTLVLLALDAEDQNDAESARASLRRADELARILKDRDLQARVCKGRAGLEFKARRFAAAATLYLRAARMLAEEASGQLAESLSGALLSAAHRGRLDEHTLEQLLNVSTRIAADAKLLGELTAALPMLAEQGKDRDIARLAAVALGVAVRLVLGREDKDPERFAPFVQAASAAAWWVATDSAHETILAEQLRDICGEEAAREIMQLVGDAVRAIKQKREEIEEENASTGLPSAA